MSENEKQLILPAAAKPPALANQVTDEERELIGVDTLGKEDRKLPRIRLIQPTSKIEGSAGQFHNSITGIQVPEFEAVILRVAKGRVWWDLEYHADAEPLCASDDGLKPREGIPNPPDGGLGCLQCPKSQWGDNKTAPPCSLCYNYLSVDVNDSMPGLFTLSKTSAKTGKQINTLMSTFGLGRGLKFSSVAVNGDKGKWFEWRVSVGGAVEDKSFYLHLAKMLSAEKVTTDTGEDVAHEPASTEQIAEINKAIKRNKATLQTPWVAQTLKDDYGVETLEALSDRQARHFLERLSLPY